MREGDTVNVFDRAVAAVAPVHAAKRAAARAALKIIDSGYGNYGANLTKKSLRGWEFYGGSAKEDIEDNIDILRQRSRDAYMGIPTASAALKTMRTNVIAGGLMPAPQIDAEFLGLTPEDAEKLQAQIVREFALWADTPVCDADRVDNFYKLQQLTFLSYAMNGDAIVLLPTKEQTGQPYSLRVRLVEADRVCSPDGFDRLVPCTVQGYDVHCIVQGVETDADGMVIAYWVCDRHPLASNAYTSGGPHWTRVEAYTKTTGRRNVLHVMNRERAGQRRGVPMLAPVLEALKQLGRYTDAEITAAVLSAMFTVFVKQSVASDARPFGEMLPPDMLIDAQDQSSIELGPGAILSLNPGEDVQFADPKHPNTGYDAFTNTLCESISAAFSVVGTGPLVLINVLDPAKHTADIAETTVQVNSGVAVLDVVGVLLDKLTVKSGSTALTRDTDYTASFNNDGTLNIVPLAGGKAASATTGMWADISNTTKARTAAAKATTAPTKPPARRPMRPARRRAQRRARR